VLRGRHRIFAIFQLESVATSDDGRGLSAVRGILENRRYGGVMRVLARFDSLGILLVNLRTVRDEERRPPFAGRIAAPQVTSNDVEKVNSVPGLMSSRAESAAVLNQRLV
jgi:hypothetical protein